MTSQNGVKAPPGEDTKETDVVEEDPLHDAAVKVAMVEDEPDVLDIEKLREQLGELRKAPIDSSTVAEMSYAELGTGLAAFIVGYDTDMSFGFEDMRCRLKMLFKREWIRGADLMHAKQDWQDTVAVLTEGWTEGAAKKMKMRFDEFRTRIQKDLVTGDETH